MTCIPSKIVGYVILWCCICSTNTVSAEYKDVFCPAVFGGTWRGGNTMLFFSIFGKMLGQVSLSNSSKKLFG